MSSPKADAPGVSWSAAAEAGFLGGVVFLILELILVPLFVGGSVWGVLRMIAAIALGRDVLPPPDTFDVPSALTGILLHVLLATFYGLLIAVPINRSGPATAFLVGALCGLGLYIVNYYLFTTLFPWFASARTWVTVLNHLVFGFVVAWAYKGIVAMPRRSWSEAR